MAEAFLEERRIALERYLATLAAHPAISKSEVGAYTLSAAHTLMTCFSRLTYPIMSFL